MLWEDVIHISGIANPRIRHQRIANSLGRVSVVALITLYITETGNGGMNMLDKTYNRFFYAIMAYYMHVRSGNDKPKIDDLTVAIIIVSCILFCDLLSLGMILEFCGLAIKQQYLMNLDIILAAIVLLFNTIYFVRRKKYQAIFEHFQTTEDEKTRRKRNQYCLAFILISFAFMIIIPCFKK